MKMTWRLPQIFLALSALLPLIRCSPSCVSTSKGEVTCTCQLDQQDYAGNLNFAKRALSRVGMSDVRVNTSLVISGCRRLRLELNFLNMGQMPGNLWIQAKYLDESLCRKA